MVAADLTIPSNANRGPRCSVGGERSVNAAHGVCGGDTCEVWSCGHRVRPTSMGDGHALWHARCFGPDLTLVGVDDEELGGTMIPVRIGALAIAATLAVGCFFSDSRPADASTERSDAGVSDALMEVWSDWLSSSAYQSLFDTEVARDRYPAEVEGRNADGRSEYRGRFVDFPLGPFRFASHHGMGAVDFDGNDARYTGEGLRLQHVQTFVDAAGTTRYNATWTSE